MEAMQAIMTRRSVRRYTAEPVSRDLVKRLLEAAMSAPSAGNEQPWQFIVITDRAILDTIPDFHPYASMLREAPMAILVCGDERLERFKGYWVLDCSAATQNLLLAAHALGLGAVWLGVYPTQDRMDALWELLGMPDEVVPFALIAVGHPAESPAPAARYARDRVHEERW